MARIEDYALLGDTQTAALVSKDGSVDWAPFPRFDSGSCFAALLGAREHGRWSIAPAAPVRAREAALSRGHAGPGDRHRDRRRRGAPHRLHAGARSGAGSGAHRRGAARSRADASGSGDPVRQRAPPALGAPARGGAGRGRRPERAVPARRHSDARRGPGHRGRLHRRGRRAARDGRDLVPVARAAAARRSIPRRRCATPNRGGASGRGAAATKARGARRCSRR